MQKSFDNKLLWALTSCEMPGFKVAHEGEWVSEGKSEYQEIVFVDEESAKCFRFTHGRAGSSFTDYCYDLAENEGETECDEVELKEVVIKKWVAV